MQRLAIVRSLQSITTAIVIITTGITTGNAPAETPEPDAVWALAYFRQRYPTRVEIDADGKVRDVALPNPMKVEQLHLALSTDGRHWKPLAGNKPVWSQGLRDPFIRRSADGTWHLLATGRARQDPRNELPPVCLHATSKDLVTWESVESLPLMKGVKDEEGRRARNIWAPEWFQDEDSRKFMLIWSSSFEDAGWKRSRLWYSRTTDWKNFEPAQVLFSPGYSVIDGSLLESAGSYYLFHKEEEFAADTGERRAIRLAVSDEASGPYQAVDGPLNDGQIVPTITEGCSVMPDPSGDGWLLLYDYCMTNRYGASGSDDLIHWKVITDVEFPPDARHGSVFRLTQEEADRLRRTFGD